VFVAVAACPVAALPSVTERVPVVRENQRAGTARWALSPAPFARIEGYPSEVSVLPGAVLHLHVSVNPAGRYRVEVYRLGWYQGLGGRLMTCLPGCTADEGGLARLIPAFDPATGYLDAGWPVTDQVRIGTSWPSGYYLADLVLTRAGGRVGARVPFVVRSSPAAAASRVLVQVPVNTWQAYNGWGGRSLYTDQTGVGDNQVSFDRPYAQTPFSEGSAQQWELPLLRFLERFGYDVAYQTDVDTDRDPSSLTGHGLVIVAGHAEYWTPRMRDAFDAARDGGWNLAFLGANIDYWQARYADETRRTLVEYRHGWHDPEPDPQLKTTWSRRLHTLRPECELLGVQFQDEKGQQSIGGPFDYSPATISDPWFLNTGLTASSTLSRLVDGEWDAIEPNCHTPPLTVLFAYNGSPARAQAVRYEAPSGALVFSSGSLAFNYALDDNRYLPSHANAEDPRLEHFLRNALNDLTSR
jgi:hypothetical protein